MKVDPEEAVTEINRLARSGMAAIGDYLIKTFFAGDIANVRGEGRNSPGFVRLRRYTDRLEIGYSSLCQILSDQKQRHQLQVQGHGELVDQINLTHQIRLLSVKDEKTKVKLLKQAVEKGWTVRQLDAAIAKHRPAPKELPMTPRRVEARLKQVGEAVKVVDKDLIKAATALPQAQRRKLRTQVEKQIKALEQLRKSLDGQG